MVDIRDQFDNMIAAVGRMSLVQQLLDKVVEADKVARRECGNCQFWMQSRNCPREHNVNGRQRGPSMSGAPCDKFAMQQRAIDLQDLRIREAIEFAGRHDLPIPTRFRDRVGGSKQP